MKKIDDISQILGGCFYFISPSNSPLTYNDIKKTKLMKAIKIMFIVSIARTFFGGLIICSWDDTIFDFRLFVLVFIAVSYTILGKLIFFHQKISLVFSFLGLIIVYISRFIFHLFTENSDWYYILIMKIACSIFLCSSGVKL